MKAPDEADFAWIVQRICSCSRPQAVYLFGSWALGQGHARSDIDLLIVEPSRMAQRWRGRQVANALAPYPRSFDLLFYTPEELEEQRADPASFASTIMTRARRLYPQSLQARR